MQVLKTRESIRKAIIVLITYIHILFVRIIKKSCSYVIVIQIPGYENINMPSNIYLFEHFIGIDNT